jgi:Toprim-like
VLKPLTHPRAESTHKLAQEIEKVTRIERDRDHGNVVALMGARISERQCELLDTYFRELVVMLDGDETGRRASQKLAARRWKNVALSLGRCPAADNQINSRLRKSIRF